MKRKFKKILSAIAGCLLIQPIAMMLFYAGTLPDSYYVRKGEPLQLSSAMPITANTADPVTASVISGVPSSQVSLRLFGILPIKNVEIQQTDEIMLVPCGQAFGIRMLMDGIMVIELGEVITKDGTQHPAEEAGLREGDIIQEVNGSPVDSTECFRNAACDGKPMHLTVQRGEDTYETELTPAYSVQQECFQTGLWVRDSTAGIGTLTYYEPATGCFGGLGHPICDPDTGELIPLASGEADAVTISGARRGQSGVPGQLRGYFSAKEPIGTLSCNNRCGLFGVLHESPSDRPAIPMALKQEITLGEAVILSTVTGDMPQTFSIEIKSIDYTSDTQNMVIEVTDEALLAATGGIVQGMSGSPILQNGRLVGAVTHVFVGEPTQGYGIFAETMYEVSRSTQK
ncbi:MAG: SpoIVB peptidase [Ruminococcus sp.]|nr:SpoIVB peptidase [Ruminococcus sp.]